ncbi:MAG: iron-containing alcohol dehydrogenase [Fimbriiglobus sp.]
MNSFTIWNPTRILFGPEHGEAFAQEVAKLGKKALVVIGGGSVERLGYLGLVEASLQKAGVKVVVFRGIEPNPNAPTVNKAAEVSRQAGVDVVVALGGGSTMDAAKAISGLIFNGEKDIWPFVVGQPKAGQLAGALPIAAIPTTAATASEVTPYSVISYYELNEKSVLAHDFFKPLVSWINPAFTTGVSPATTADGAADILSHVFENYFLGGNDSPLADGYTETVIRVVLEALPKALKNPEDVAVRGQLLWASTLALNGYQLAGRSPAEFVLHSMEHALSGFSPNLAHGRGLATLYPSYFRWLHAEGRAHDRLARFGRVLFGVTEASDSTAAMQGIEAFEGWLKSVGLFQSLESLGFEPSQYRAIADYCVKVYGNEGQLNACGPLAPDAIVKIFENTARQR